MSRLALVALLGLAACASQPGRNSYAAELDRLEADCRERGGILLPIPGAQARTGNPGAAFTCNLPGGSISRP